MKYFKFVNWEAANIDNVLTGRLPQAMLAYDNGDKKPLIEYFRMGGHADLMKNGYFRIGGWQFSIKEYCKKYWVKVKYYGIIEVYSPDKTSIRNTYGKHNVFQIIEV